MAELSLVCLGVESSASIWVACELSLMFLIKQQSCGHHVDMYSVGTVGISPVLETHGQRHGSVRGLLHGGEGDPLGGEGAGHTCTHSY